MLSEEIIVLVAEEAEERMVRSYLPGIRCIRTGVGASNVISICYHLPEGSRVFNIGYAGSNVLPIGTVTTVSKSFRLMDNTYQFVDHNNPLEIQGGEYPCYTNNSFVTESELEEPSLFDMELNYMAAFPFELVGAIKIVSDNLSVDAFRNNAIRESGILTSADVWEKVRDLFNSIAGA